MKQDLFKKLQDVKKFDEEKLRFYACEIILALEHLHELGIVYGDLKPENVLLDAQNHVCLCDFGYLRARKKNIKGVYGTPEYMAPETLQNHSNQLYYTDFWQLGILLFELLYSHPPFMGRDYDQLFDFILNCPIEFPVSVPSSDAIKDLLFRVLTRNIKAFEKRPEGENRLHRRSTRDSRTRVVQRYKLEGALRKASPGTGMEEPQSDGAKPTTQ